MATEEQKTLISNLAHLNKDGEYVISVDGVDQTMEQFVTKATDGDKFNEKIESYRTKYNSLFLTNYRESSKNYSRKRISFDLAYNIISYLLRTEF